MDLLSVVAMLGFLLLPISIFVVEAKSAYDSFRAWRAGRADGA